MTDGENPEPEEGLGPAPGRTPGQRTRWLLATAGVVLITGLGAIYYVYLPEPKHVLPRSAVDWSAWGTWVGALGAVTAVLYAARQFRLSRLASDEERDARRQELDQLDLERTLAASTLRALLSTVDSVQYGEDFDSETQTMVDVEESTGDATDLIFTVLNTGKSSFKNVRVFLPQAFQKVSEWTTTPGFVNLRERSGFVPQGAPTTKTGAEPTGWYLLGDLAPGKAERISWHLASSVEALAWKFGHEIYAEEDRSGYGNGTCVVYQDEEERTWRRFPHLARAQRIFSREIDCPVH